MSRAAWTAIIGGLVALGIAVGAVAAFLGGDEESTRSVSETTVPEARGFELPLAGQPGTLALGGHDRNLLVGIAARPGGPLELAALRGEDPVPRDELRVELNGRIVRAEPCGNGCSRVSAPVLAGRARSLTVRGGAQVVSFDLPGRLPPDGTDVFGKASRTMSELETFRFTERLSSGLGTTVNSTIDVQAPDRMRLRTRGFSSVIIGQNRWDRRAGTPWEPSPFPGLDVKELLMWHQAKNPRTVRRLANGESELVAFGLKPVPAWFRLNVEPSGRVTEAEMTAASHFMLHRYTDFDEGVTVEPPVAASD
jgi:hypothetical protein